MAELIATGPPAGAHRAICARPIPRRPCPGRPGLLGHTLMHSLVCPRCGRRSLDEFAFGGERRPVPDWITDPDERDYDEVWVFENPDGETIERWFHAHGLSALADGPARCERRTACWRCCRDRRLADRQLELLLRGRVAFGVGAIERLPGLVAATGWPARLHRHRCGGRGVRGHRSGAAPWSPLPTSRCASTRTVEPNPGTSSIERGSAALPPSAWPTPWSCQSAAVPRWTRPRRSRCTP